METETSFIPTNYLFIPLKINFVDFRNNIWAKLKTESQTESQHDAKDTNTYCFKK